MKKCSYIHLSSQSMFSSHLSIFVTVRQTWCSYHSLSNRDPELDRMLYMQTQDCQEKGNAPLNLLAMPKVVSTSKAEETMRRLRSRRELWCVLESQLPHHLAWRAGWCEPRLHLDKVSAFHFWRHQDTEVRMCVCHKTCSYVVFEVISCCIF